MTPARVSGSGRTHMMGNDIPIWQYFEVGIISHFFRINKELQIEARLAFLTKYSHPHDMSSVGVLHPMHTPHRSCGTIP